MEQPLGFVIDSNIVFRLQKSLYGLKKDPWAWYENIDQFFVNLGFKHCESNHSIYVLHVKGDTLIVAVYVVDLVLIKKNPSLIFRLKSRLADTFEMTILGMLHFFLGIQVLPL
jgi:hypothetical protein